MKRMGIQYEIPECDRRYQLPNIFYKEYLKIEDKLYKAIMSEVIGREAIPDDAKYFSIVQIVPGNKKYFYYGDYCLGEIVFELENFRLKFYFNPLSKNTYDSNNSNG